MPQNKYHKLMRFLTTLLYEMDVIVELERLLLESVPREPDGL